MVPTLREGANTPLDGRDLTVRVSGLVEVVALVVDARGKVAGDADMVFYNQPTTCGVHLSGTTLDMNLDGLRPGADKVVLAVAAEQDGIAVAATDTGVEIYHGGPVLSFVPTRLRDETVVVLVEFYRRDGGWKVRALGMGYDNGLAGLARDFGVDVEDSDVSQQESSSDGTSAAVPARRRSPAPAGSSGPPVRTRRPVSSPSPGPPDELDLWNQRFAGTRVAGVSYRKDAVRRVLGSDHRPDGAAHERRARLVLEPDNPHDPDAVAVHIDGEHVGYLPAQQAPDYGSVLRDLVDRNLVPHVGADIWARDLTRWDETREREVSTGEVWADISLRLGPSHLVAPANDRPAGTEMLPEGRAIQVSRVGDHVDVTRVYNREHVEQWVHVTLHEILVERNRTRRTLVEVRLDGNRVGELTPRMSEELLPAIRALARTDRLAGARGLLQGNQAAGKIRLHVARSSELTADWFATRDPGAVG